MPVTSLLCLCTVLTCIFHSQSLYNEVFLGYDDDLTEIAAAYSALDMTAVHICLLSIMIVGLTFTRWQHIIHESITRWNY